MTDEFSEDYKISHRRRWNFSKDPKFKTRANKNWMGADKVDVEALIKKMLLGMKEPE